jgi:hypothetical protein
VKLRLLLALLAALLTLGGCAAPGRLTPAQSTLADVEAAMGAPAERRQVGGETWLYYPSQPFGRKVLVARIGGDGRLVAVEQRLSEEYIAKVVPNQSRRDDVLALFGQPFERHTYERLQREAWSWHMQKYGFLPAGLHVQISPDGVVREVLVLDERNDSDKADRP